MRLEHLLSRVLLVEYKKALEPVRALSPPVRMMFRRATGGDPLPPRIPGLSRGEDFDILGNKTYRRKTREAILPEMAGPEIKRNEGAAPREREAARYFYNFDTRDEK